MNKKWLVISIFLWALLIFLFSSQSYQKQDISSDLDPIVQELHIETLFSGVSFWYGDIHISVDSMGPAHFLEFFIRKLAHLTIFLVFGFLSCSLLRYYIRHRSLLLILSLLCVICYASLDEFHQSMTSGRTPMVQDVGVDTMGGILGIALSLYLMRPRKTRIGDHRDRARK